MDMGTQGSGRKRLPTRERLSAEDDALSLIAREAEARLAAKRAARAEAREIRMKELERQQKEEDSERYSRRSRRSTTASEEDERLSGCSRGSLRAQPDAELGGSFAWANGYDRDGYGTQALSRRPSRVEERPERDFVEKGSRNMPSLCAAALASLGGTSSRRGSGDTSISAGTEASIREIKELNELKDQIQDVEGKYMQGLKEMKDSLAEVEEKYKKAMVSNAQLDNEKTNFMYQVDTLKDLLLQVEEELAESRRQYEEKNKECEREKHAHGILQFQFAEVKEALKQREEMLEEIRQLQQKQATCVRELSDLQETIEWKDKKIGALERQKEFFDSLRSERDDLRDEVVTLREELKKHGIVLNAEAAPNSTLNGLSPSTVTTEEAGALTSTGDGALGRARASEVENAMVAAVGRGASLQEAGHEQHTEGGGEDHARPAGSLPAANPEDPRPAAEGQAPPSEAPATSASEERPESAPGDGPGTCPEAEQCQGNALDQQDERQAGGKEEDGEAHLGEVRVAPCLESGPPHRPEVDRAGGTDAGGACGSPTEAVEEAEVARNGEHAGTVASGPPGGHREPMNQDGNHMSDQEATELQEALAQPVEAQREKEEEDGGAEPAGEEHTQTRIHTPPCSPAATGSHQQAQGAGEAGPGGEPLHLKEPEEDRGGHGGEPSGSPQKKTKNKKKKNKKKKSPAAVETLGDVKEEATFQKADQSEGSEEKQGGGTEGRPAGEAPPEGTQGAVPETVPESSDRPEGPDVELNGTLSQEDEGVETEAGRGLSGGDAFSLAEDTTVPTGTGAGDQEAAESAANDTVGREDAPEGSSVDPEEDVSGASQTDSTEEHVMSAPSQTPGDAVESTGLEQQAAAAAPLEEPGDLESEDREDPRGGTEKGKSKEDCTMS
ncbi:leucine-rich repeat flightless-interacting protein 1 isoform X4 [Tenrec ecaudatus]|uniref:leucine-rich repeat flightless-interacting protein 1 isoform X4 n=1 Tax=Tenrec ecaudatus TaxID=94439 RepID=UPI003F5995EC